MFTAPRRPLQDAPNNAFRRASLENLVEASAVYNDSRARTELRQRLARTVKNFRNTNQAKNALLRLKVAVHLAGVNLNRNEEGAIRSLFGLHYVRR